MTRKPVLIAGPTASGKSAVALEVAARLGGTIINADSMQVYRDLRIITARPTVQEEAQAPHRLYGPIDAAENYSVGRWCDDVQMVLAGVATQGRVPIVVGGTGLYFKALTEGLRVVPPVPDAIRQEVRARMDRDGPQALHAELARLDPLSADRLKPADWVRIARALEVWHATGRSLNDGQHESGPPLIDPTSAVRVFLTPDRDALHRRIDARFDAMLTLGALDEVRALDARGLDPLLPAMKAHGVPWLRRYLHGEISLDEAAEGGKADTRRYTKRQMTWFRHQMPDWVAVAPEAAVAQILTATGDF